MTTYHIALGSNLGDRMQNLRAAGEALQRLHHPEAPFLASRVYETDPVDCAPGDPLFLNAVVALQSALGPLELLDALQAIEQQMGRPPEHEVNAPRTIDLDLLAAGDWEFTHPRLILPHPRIAIRRFVLAPLCDLSPTCNCRAGRLPPQRCSRNCQRAPVPLSLPQPYDCLLSRP
ncbi:MAG: 2-amino-4-hydroxy-6-hydroxymethyldihydropteridine diphosphokinase [Chthoniobacteraceae bacterium]